MTSTQADRWGAPVQVRRVDGVRLLDRAVDELVRMAGDPLASAMAALDADDGLILARVFLAYLHLYATTSQGARAAGAILDQVDRSRLAPRERLHLEAAEAWASADWPRATRKLEDALLADPRDLLALKVAQDLYFFLGNRLDLRDVAARVLPSWPREAMGWGYVQGMYAFGLEECGQYRAAEKAAREALAADRADVWAAHALAHVFEMEARAGEGEDFLSASSSDWGRSYFAVHNWWHLALFKLDLQNLDGADDVYRGRIRETRSMAWLDIVDAAALLALVAVRPGRDLPRRRVGRGHRQRARWSGLRIQ